MINQMPSSSHLATDRLALRALDLLTGDLGRAFETRVLLTNVARLVDRSIVRYRSAGEHFDEFCTTGSQGNFSALFRAVSEFEECIVCVHRATAFAKPLFQQGVLDTSLQPNAAAMTAVKDMRDALTHLDDRILGLRGPRVTQGQHTFPMPEDTEIVLGVHHLSYSALLEVISSLHAALEQPLK